MNNWQEQAGPAGPRQVARAVAEREQGRRKLNAATMTVTVASVAAAGVVVAVLPGTSHAATKSSSSSSSSTTSSSSNAGSSSDDGSSNSSNSSSSQSGLQAPASSPQVSTGGGANVTSGGS